MKLLNISHAAEIFSHLWVWQLSLHCERDYHIWQSLEHCLCLLFQSLYLCVMMKSHFKCAECTCQGILCVSVTWKSLNHVHNKLKSEILQTEEEQACLFTKLSWLHKTLCQTQDCAKQKTLCLLKKISNNNDGDEETPQPETLFQLLITCQTTFDSLILLPSSLKVLKCSCAIIEVFYEFSCVFRGVVFLSLDEIVGFFTNHLFF
jgi:hypothetical protein